MIVDGYVRVSTQEQAKEGYSIGAQTECLKSYCAARGWTLRRIHTDPGYSGAKLERPAMKELIQDVYSRNTELILVYKLDRLSRSQKDTLYLIEDVFLKNNVAFVSINENFDTSTAFGRAMMGILSVFAQLEREQIKERTQMGRIERAKNGLWKGGGRAPVGYDYVESTNQLIINEYEAMQVREAFDLFVNQLYSMNRICTTFMSKGYTHKSGDWRYRSTVRLVLMNPIYIGKIIWEGITYEGVHPSLVSQEIFDAAQERMKKLPAKTDHPFQATQLLSGIIYCKNCGARYFGYTTYRGSKKLPYTQRRRIHLYACYSRAKTKRDMIRDPTCKNKFWPAEELDQYVTDEIKKLCTSRDYFDGLWNKPKPDDDKKAKREILYQRVSALDEQILKLLDLYQFNRIPTERIAERLESLSSEKETLEKELESLQDVPSDRLTPQQAIQIAMNAQHVLSSGTMEERRNLVQSIVRRIDILENEITITWRFN